MRCLEQSIEALDQRAVADGKFRSEKTDVRTGDSRARQHTLALGIALAGSRTAGDAVGQVEADRALSLPDVFVQQVKNAELVVLMRKQEELRQ